MSSKPMERARVDGAELADFEARTFRHGIARASVPCGSRSIGGESSWRDEGALVSGQEDL